MLPKVLVCAPTNVLKAYCLDEYLCFIKSMTYPNYEILLCDNSETKEFSETIKSYGVNCKWVNPKGKNRLKYMWESQELLRKYAIKHGFDYMFMLESDVFPPYTDIIERLMMHNKSVVSAMYHIRDGVNSHLCIQLADGDPDFAAVYNLESPNDLLFVDGKCKEVYASGLGCTLIRRNILMKIPFKYVDMKIAADSWFYADLHTAGIKAFLDTSIICQHKNLNWDYIPFNH